MLFLITLLFSAIIFSGGLVIYDMKIESIEIRKELEAEQQINDRQEEKIKETYSLMREAAKDNARIAQSIESLTSQMSATMQQVSNDTAEIRRRIDRHIEDSKH